MSKFFAYTAFARPGLHVWREGTSTKLYLQPVSASTGPGWVQFEYDFEPGVQEAVCFMLFDFDDNGNPAGWEKPEHQRKLPRRANGAFADNVWFTQDTARVLESDPRSATRPQLRIHLISRARYRPSELYIWDAAADRPRRISMSGTDDLGPVFEVSLGGQDQSFFNFKFIRREDPADSNSPVKTFEPDFANRLWSASDGAEIWTHSESEEITPYLPEKRILRVHFQQSLVESPVMHLWQQNSDFSEDVHPRAISDGWVTFQKEIYTNQNYGVLFHNPALAPEQQWEHSEARRRIRITSDEEFWTLEGDSALFRAEPKRDRQVRLLVSIKPPFSGLGDNLFTHVWVNRARGPMLADVAVAHSGEVSFKTYPNIVTSVKFRDTNNRWEHVERHTLQAQPVPGTVERYVVLERSALLSSPPPPDLFSDPPFNIRRPGAYDEGGDIRVALHAPAAARVEVVGEWSPQPLPMKSTRDGAYWWARIPKAGLGDYHGRKYRFRMDETVFTQDPAAGWVESSWNQAWSRLVRSDKFVWQDQNWQRPGREYLSIYQVHPRRFTNRFPNDPPLKRLTREISEQGGYLRDLGITAILLMPLNEVGTENSWGYDPAYFYAIENDYGGPDALKELVNTCHQNGLAVLLDVVFNHAGTTDNILWSLAQQTFFDGDTEWGAMVNFDHPQCVHFFAQNLVYLAKEYHLDGFRLDHTGTIVHSAAWDQWSRYVKQLGSGGGWDFLHALRSTLHSQVDSRCLLMAEHLPNEWSLTNFGGPMDTQWCDDFHDVLVKACRGEWIMPALANALKLSHTACDDWYKVTNYPESHDEVGNTDDRIANVAGWGRGLRMSKVAAAATLLSRGIPLFFMGAESGEHRQFKMGQSTTLDLDHYLLDDDKGRVRGWWRQLLRLRRNPAISGPAPVDVRFADGQLLAFSRGNRGDYFVLLNFGAWTRWHPLDYLNLGDGVFRELWNSTWPAFAINGEQEDEHTNGGRDARVTRSNWLQIPDYGVIILERMD